MKKLEYKSFEIKSFDYNSETDELIIDGYAAVFNVEDALGRSIHPETRQIIVTKDIIENGAFEKTLQENGNRIAMCLNHVIENPIAKIIDLFSDEVGLYVKARISDSEPALKTKIREGIYKELSFGFNAIRATLEQMDGYFLRRLKELQVWEISIVTIARNGLTKFNEAKSLEFVDTLIKTEKNEEKKYQLLQLRSLLDDTPDENPPIEQTPNKEKEDALDFTKIKFIN